MIQSFTRRRWAVRNAARLLWSETLRISTRKQDCVYGRTRHYGAATRHSRNPGQYEIGWKSVLSRCFGERASPSVTKTYAPKNKTCLVILDGWGVSEQKEGNATYHAKTSVMDGLIGSADKYLTLDSSGLAVGLPDGLMGNSEIGHFTLGSGRVVYQDIVKINKAVDENRMIKNKNFVEACEKARNGNGRLHFLGLVSDGGVHSHINHLFSLIECAKKLGVQETFIQYFADGRDTSPTSGVMYIEQVLNKLQELQYGSLATVTGRYYAMDRDKRYERNKIAYEGLVQGVGELTSAEQVTELLKKRYVADDCQTDEFLTPIIVNSQGCIQDGDTLVFINFRADRMRQLVEALGVKPQFETDKILQNVNVYTMAEYKKEFSFPILFPSEVPRNVLAEWLSTHSISQYHVAETEKYAHVTFFFNGGQEAQFKGEDRKLVLSPNVATYDLQPEMSCDAIAHEVCIGLKSGEYPFVMCNFAAPDMVGHTGDFEAALKACEATDFALGQIKSGCEESGYVLFVTADHGNVEKMFSDDGGPHTAHTTFRVPFIIANTEHKLSCPSGHNASLCDVAMTVLDVMGVEAAPEMTGCSLLVNDVISK